MSRRQLSRRQLLAVGGAASAGALSGPLLAPAAQAALPQVPRRKLGKTGKSIPILLFGGASGLQGSGAALLAEAMRYGVDYVDAARSYDSGRCERGLAEFHQRGKLRKRLWITTKSDRHFPAAFAEEVDASLKQLDTSYVDLYFLHGLRDPQILSPALGKVVADLQRSGKIRHFGFSCHGGNVPALLHAAAKTPWVEAVMFRYNFRQYGNRDLNEAMDAAHKAGVGLIAMKTQGAEASFRDSWETFEQSGKWNKHQAVLKAVWADRRITAICSHMDDMAKLRQNIGAAVDRHKLTHREVEALQRYAQQTRPLACDGCDHLCGGAVDAPVRIADTLRFVMYHDSYGERAKARRLFRQLPAAARAIDGVDFAAAARACPHGVDVGRYMKRALDVLA